MTAVLKALLFGQTKKLAVLGSGLEQRRRVHTLGVRHGYTWNDASCDNCLNFTCFTGDKCLV